jgi:hypothetical protein
MASNNYIISIHLVGQKVGKLRQLKTNIFKPTVNMSAPFANDEDPAMDPPTPLCELLPFLSIGHPDTMMSAESVRRAAQDFLVRPTDIIVATFPKTGTTLITWICHLLRTNCDDLQFETIYDVVPWPLLAWDVGQDLNDNSTRANQYSPRVFKSHLRMASVYRGCKYIVVVRDPTQTAISFYNFIGANANQQLHPKSLSAFLQETPFVKGDANRASLWEFYQEYHILRDCPSVLVLVYEDLVHDMPCSIQRIAKFMGIRTSAELIDTVAAMSTKQFMAAHMTKLNEPYERAKLLGRIGDLSQLALGPKVTLAPHADEMDDAAHQFMKDRWRAMMEPLGYPDYDAFATMFRTKNEQRFGE